MRRNLKSYEYNTRRKHWENVKFDMVVRSCISVPANRRRRSFWRRLPSYDDICSYSLDSVLDPSQTLVVTFA